MPNAKEWAEYFYPFLFNAEDKRYINTEDFDMALEVALDYRPACLTENRQNQAQAHYAAYVADFRKRANDAGLSISQADIVSGPVVEKQEGDTRIKYATSANSAISAMKEQLTGPGTAYAAFLALWELCHPAVADGQSPVRRGAIITAFG